MRPCCLALVLTAACAAPLPPGEEGRRADFVVGGFALGDGGQPAVFMLRADFDNAVRAACTATLVTPRTLLTAAHCVDPRKAGATSVQLFAVGLPVAPASTDPAWVQAVDSRFHPQYVPGDLFSYDIAAVLLPAASAVAPIPYNARDVVPRIGQPLVAVGYGITGEGLADYGTRRAVNLTIRDATAKHVVLGDQSGKGICDGDSGGPSLHTFPDGVTRVIGVHSYKQPSGACHDGLDTRVDLFAGFVRQWISDKEGPTCGEDGLCKATGCTPADPDCTCVADGQCRADCPNLLSDPDCPVDCVGNGVCATAACPAPDPDCVPDFQACTADAQCRARTCATDAQRAQRYCSRQCAAPADCPGGTGCTAGFCLLPQSPEATRGQGCLSGFTLCLGGTSCVDFGAGAVCTNPCTGFVQCQQGEECSEVDAGVRYCRIPPQTVPTLRADLGPASSSGCASAGGQRAALAAVAWALLRAGRRSRRARDG